MKGRARAYLTTLFDMWAENYKEGKEEKGKRVRLVEDEEVREVFKRNNKLRRTPPKQKGKEEEDGKEMEEKDRRSENL